MWKLWTSFVQGSSIHIHALAPSELQVCLWLVFLKMKGLSPITIRTYLYSLSSEIKLRGGPPFMVPKGAWFIHSTLKAITRTTPCKGPVFRRPITVPVLKVLLGALDFSSGDDLLYGAMVTVGVFGMFRINELCAVGRIASLKFIRNKDVSFHQGHAIIKLYNTKTKKEVTKVLADVQGQVCNPCGLLWSFIMAKGRKAPDGPLFISKKGRAVTRPMFVQFIRERLGKLFPSINPQEWNGASLRKGGATSALKAGVPGELIAQLGHWDSDVYKRYLHCSVSDFTKAQASYAALAGKPDERYPV